MSDPTPLTQAQMQALMTPQMQAMMTAYQQNWHQAAYQAAAQIAPRVTWRLPTDSTGKSFTPNAQCTVQQPPQAALPLPPTLVGNTVKVIDTVGERVRVRYLNGEEREFHRTELGVQ